MENAQIRNCSLLHTRCSRFANGSSWRRLKTIEPSPPFQINNLHNSLTGQCHEIYSNIGKTYRPKLRDVMFAHNFLSLKRICLIHLSESNWSGIRMVHGNPLWYATLLLCRIHNCYFILVDFRPGSVTPPRCYRRKSRLDNRQKRHCVE